MTSIDIHTHGIGGYDTHTADHEHILKIAEIHGAQDVSAILPTIYPAPIEEMRANMMAVKKAMERQSSKFEVQGQRSENSQVSILRKAGQLETRNSKLPGNRPSRILGVHLEGPFLNPARCGALDPSSLLDPAPENLKRIVEGFEEMIRIITVAPELDGAAEIIRRIADLGIIVSMGHSNATYAEAEAGLHAGASGITHIFNAMRGFHHREPGIAGFGLSNKHIYVEVIADPYHLHTETTKMIFALKPRNRIIIVSDSVRGTRQKAKGGRPWHAVTDSRGKLLGGSMTVVESAQRLVKTGLRQDAVLPCISDNPARYLGID